MLEIQLLAVNEIGFSSGNSAASQTASPASGATGVCPFIDDNVVDDIWSTWQVTFRDVVILDQDNVIVGEFNLTQNNLSSAANRETLKAMLVAAATP